MKATPSVPTKVRCELAHGWVRMKNESKLRKDAATGHHPGAAGATKGKGTGKDENGEPQVCFAWRNTGVCAKKDAGACNYAHPQNQKNTGSPKGDNGKGKDGKRSSSTPPRGSKGGKGQRQPGTPQGGKTVTDPKLLCQHYSKGQCTKGKACTYHHNGPCSFHKKGICNKGDKCVFSHHDPAAQLSMVATGAAGNSDNFGPARKGPADAKAKAKATTNHNF